MIRDKAGISSGGRRRRKAMFRRDQLAEVQDFLIRKDGGGAALENASRFPLSHTLDGCGHQLGSAMLESPNPENVSLRLDYKWGQVTLTRGSGCAHGRVVQLTVLLGMYHSPKQHVQ